MAEQDSLMNPRFAKHGIAARHVFPEQAHFLSDLISVGSVFRRIASRQLYSGGRKRAHDAISVVTPLHLHGRRNFGPRLAVLAKLRSSDDIPEDISDIALRHIIFFQIPVQPHATIGYPAFRPTA